MGPMVVLVTRLRALALVPVLLALGACSGSVSAGSDGGYDADKVAAEVQKAQEKVTPDLEVADATCPEDADPEEGTVLDCSVTIDGVEAPYAVTITSIDDGKAKFSLEPTKAIISAAAAVGFIEDQAEQQGLGDATAECGDAAVIVQDPQTTFPCTLTNGEQVQDITLLIEDLDGTVSIDSTS